ncbi:hypothetical protein [Altererythrobacter lutimaris]|uniref:Uncharacterized protein n=1 Tax=Altererythrobacter lutimaris TaxID=2743979 RepID=A0A850HIE6_9SPHN|nr:hypothetical protein [Altererythrobacter lutimaris]NVE95312.1 hypothetical protein [Altererythrobacter lutimaris]
MSGELPVELRTAITASLEEVAQLVEALGSQLCLNPELVSGFLNELQSIDLAAQTLRCNAAVISAENPVEAARTVKLQQLSDQFATALTPLTTES